MKEQIDSSQSCLTIFWMKIGAAFCIRQEERGNWEKWCVVHQCCQILRFWKFKTQTSLKPLQAQKLCPAANFQFWNIVAWPKSVFFNLLKRFKFEIFLFAKSRDIVVFIYPKAISHPVLVWLTLTGVTSLTLFVSDCSQVCSLHNFIALYSVKIKASKFWNSQLC